MTAGSAAALFVTMVVLSFAPGPTEVALVARSVSSGITSGLLMVFGIVIADFLFIIVAVTGLATVAASLGPLFAFVQYAAGGYLLFLGLSQIRGQPGASPTLNGEAESGFRSFSTGLLLTLGDPKAILGYMSLLPAFVDLSRVSIVDTLAIMALATTAISLAKGCYVVLADRSAALLTSSRIRGRLDTLAGCTLAATGVFLVCRSYLARSL